MKLTKRLILASGSPRRADLLRALGIEGFEIVRTDADESIPPGTPAAQVPAVLAERKSQAAAHLLTPDSVVLTADSLVFLGEEIIGKPADLAEAREILRKLCGAEHRVVTAFTLARLGPEGRALITTRSVTTFVELAAADAAEIEYYVRTAPPLDRAGAYGVQDWIGLAKATRLTGSYTNVVGLPTAEVYAALLELGIVAFD